MKKLLLNSKVVGEFELSPFEAQSFNASQQMLNSFGYQVDITTLTGIYKKVVEQKFFTVNPIDYMPIAVGENPYVADILTYKEYSTGGDFESGVINTGSSNSKIAETDAAVEGIRVPIQNWAKQVSWTKFDLELASRSGNWSLIEAKERSRKKNYDLGIQDIAFFGSKINTNIKGLLNQSAVTANTTLITKLINAMNAAEFSALVAGLISAYRINVNYTAMPTHFIIPEADYNGLGDLVPGSVGTYPVSKLEYLQKMFAMLTRNSNFKILPCAYADKANNASVSGLNKNVYTLLNYDMDSIRMDIPLIYNALIANTINGFQWQSVAMSQYGGCYAYRPAEMLYFTWG